MSIRFLDSNYYKSPFVRTLKGALKSLYSFIICDCDGAGIWNLDLEVASMYIGFQVSHEEFVNFFVNKGKAIDVGGNKFFFPDFIEHQYPNGLQTNNKAHKNFIKTLQNFGLVDEKLKVNVGKKGRGFEAPLVLSCNGNSQSNGNSPEKGIFENEKESGILVAKHGFFSDSIDKAISLTEIEINMTIEYISLSCRKRLSEIEVQERWKAFKIQQLSLHEWYNSHQKLIKHFRDHLKIIIQKDGTHKHVPGGFPKGTSASRIEAAQKLR